jgi:CDP-4-dehydro-6-deoxyglucose reductase
MVAGGTGYAPIQSMLSWARETGQNRPIRFYWGVRDEQALYARDTLDGLVGQLPDFRWVPVLSRASAGEGWRGAQGLVHQAVLADMVDLSGLDIYVAGPPALVEAARRDFSRAGADPGAVYFDAFEFAPDAIAAARASAENYR